MPVKGACRCEAVTYTVKTENLPTIYACHCVDCQTWSGSAFAEHALLPEEAIDISGPTTVYTHTGVGGFVSRQIVCEVCHTRICNSNSAVPGMLVLRAGTLEASDRLEPSAHIWVKRKQPWLVIPVGVPSWEETPSPLEFGAALQDGITGQPRVWDD